MLCSLHLNNAAQRATININLQVGDVSVEKETLFFFSKLNWQRSREKALFNDDPDRMFWVRSAPWSRCCVTK